MFLLEKNIISNFKDYNDLYNEVEMLIENFSNTVPIYDILNSLNIRYRIVESITDRLPHIERVIVDCLKNLDLKNGTTKSTVRTRFSFPELIITVGSHVNKIFINKRQTVSFFTDVLKKTLIKLFGSKFMNYSTMTVEEDYGSSPRIHIDLHSKLVKILDDYSINKLPLLFKKFILKLNSNLTDLKLNNAIISSKMNKASPEVSVKLIEPFKYGEHRTSTSITRTANALVQFNELNGNSYKVILIIECNFDGSAIIDVDVEDSDKLVELIAKFNKLNLYHDQYKDSTKLDNLIRIIAEILYPHWYK